MSSDHHRSDVLRDWRKVTASYIIFQEGDIYKAKNGLTGKIDFENSMPDIGALVNMCIAQLDYGGSIKFMRGIYKQHTQIAWHAKVIDLVGEGSAGHGGYYSTQYGTIFAPYASIGANACIKIGDGGATPTEGGGIHHIGINGMYGTGYYPGTILGGIELDDCSEMLFEDVIIDSLGRDTPSQFGWKVYSSTARSSHDNLWIKPYNYDCYYGMIFGRSANFNIVVGGMTTTDTKNGSYGILFDRTIGGAPAGCDTNRIFAHNIESKNNTGSIGLYVKYGTYHEFYGLRFESNIRDIQIDSPSADNKFFGGLVDFTKVVDGGARTQFLGTGNSVSKVDSIETQIQAGGWANPSGFTNEGRIVSVYNSTVGGFRFYTYISGGWRFAALI